MMRIDSKLPIARASYCSGFTLVEVLVALVVLSVGLLGMAKLVMVSAHANDSAYLRSQATALAYEILDKMRANPAGAIAHAYDVALNTMPGSATSCVTIAIQCSPAQVAAWDLYSWEQHLTTAVSYGTLPSGTATIATSATTPLTATIKVQWNDSAAQSVFGPPLSIGTPATMQIVLETVIQ